MDSHHTIKHYAILIGIDDYPHKPLKSCVRDVQDIRVYLERVLQDSIKIQMITASKSDLKPPDTGKDPIVWPTYDNVVSALKTVTSLARSGDFVYIHYSGHGTRKPPSGEFSNRSTGDLALVLLHGGEENQVKYLWGFELASLLKVMANNGLIITLVLDCCFSASVYRRDDPNIRFLPYDANVDSEYSLDPQKYSENDSPAYRDASMVPNWLINPDRYAILTACGPHEEAIGPRFDGQSHGALSYFLLGILECVGLTKKHEEIYNYLCAKFRGSGLPQNPVLYGNRDQGFFGQVNSDITTIALPIIVKQNGTLELQAGHAHGINDGDRFILYPLSSDQCNSGSQGQSVAAMVIRTRALTSDLGRSDMSSICVRTGWMARAVIQRSLQRFPIRLASSLPYRDEWLKALRERSLNVYVDKQNDLFAFEVVLDNNRGYLILNESNQEIINLPAISQDQTSIREISNLLKHLARFESVRHLANKAPADSFVESFDVHIFKNGMAFGPGSRIEIEHGTMAELAVENKGDNVLYVFMYDLSPCWQVKNMFRATYMVVPPQNDQKQFKRNTRKNLRMGIPEQMKDKGCSSCEDIVKVFVTSRPTSFDLLELPKLGEIAMVSKVDRSDRDGGDGLGDWVAMNFPIRVSLRADTDS
ncbi:MAG: hypothetical protein M1840_008313 [Geoglossum simile]|nr:MAG: hypothetical protein M1840_008313 [Geoglossum simile]